MTTETLNCTQGEIMLNGKIEEMDIVELETDSQIEMTEKKRRPKHIRNLSKSTDR